MIFCRAALLLVAATPVIAATLPATETAGGLVVTAQHLASDVGAQILREGGNAADAAIAVGYAEAVVNPCCGNIGGGGFMTVRMADRRAAVLDFRETAPAAATETMFLGADGKPVADASLFGARAVGVPGTVAGLELARTSFGTLPRESLLAPAIKLARDGFVLEAADVDILDARTKQFAADPVMASIFLRPDGSPWRAGDRLVQADLAATLRRISDLGADGFYAGPVAAAIEATGGPTRADLLAYRAVTRTPISCAWRDMTILAPPPPSSGGVTLCEILGVLSGDDLGALGWHGAASAHLMVEAERHAFLDRNTQLGDPAFVADRVPRLLSPEYERAVREDIGPQATASAALRDTTPPHEKAETTAYVVMDAAGDAVSTTYTLNGLFGAMVMAPGTGVLLNDEMDDFTVAPDTPNLFGLVQGRANRIAPGKRPLSSMTPIVGVRDGRAVLVAGSPGGSRIITTVLETVLNLTVFGMNPAEAVAAPRLHQQWLPDTVFAEPFALSPDTRAMLEAIGTRVSEQAPWGDAVLIAVGPDAAPAAKAPSGSDAARSLGAMRPGLRYGASDPRRPAGSVAVQ